ncbi:MAG: hypothetical protein EOP51_24255, partial [Sphingobacteriales bacterium]
SNVSFTNVTIPTGSGGSGGSSSSSSSSSAAAFNFQNDAPAIFKYPLDVAGVPDLGASQFVATTQGTENVVGGAATYSVKLDLPPAVRNLMPALALNYNSRAGNGLVGIGWSIGGLSTISRCRATYATEGIQAQDSNPINTNSDRLCLDGQKLVLSISTAPASDDSYWASGAEYKTEVDNFSKITAYGSANGTHAYFKVVTKSGLTLTFGGEAESQNSRIPVSGPVGGMTNVWALDSVQDAYGNRYTVTYFRDTVNGEYYPTRINYAPDSAVVFSYKDRAGNTPWGYSGGNYYQRKKILEKITTYIGVMSPSFSDSGTPVKQYNVSYDISANTQREVVRTIEECGYESSSWKCAKPLTFTWQPGEFGFDDVPTELKYCTGEVIYGGSDPLDFDGDGYEDLIGTGTNAGPVAWGTASGCFTKVSWTRPLTWKKVDIIKTNTGNALLVSLGSGEYHLAWLTKAGIMTEQTIGSNSSCGPVPLMMPVDVNHDGLTDFHACQKLWIQQNTSPTTFIAQSSTFAYSYADTFEPSLDDFNGDGLPDLVKGKPDPGGLSIPRKGAIGFVYVPGTGFVDQAMPGFLANDNDVIAYGPYHNFPPIMWKTPLDVNGDGVRDYAVHRDGRWSVFVGQQGKDFNMTQPYDIGITPATPAPGEKNPANQYAFAYDYNKDGLTDLITIITAAGPTQCGMRVSLAGYTNNKLTFTELKNSDGTTKVFAPQVFGTSGCTVDSDPARARFLSGDVNNDGIPDLRFRYLGKMQHPDLLKSVVNGFGAKVELEYSTLTGADN